jgi:hypothetical protein
MKNINIFKSITLIGFVVFFAIGLNVKAQDKPARERAEELTNTMACELDLLKSQIPDVIAINLKAALKMDSARIEAKGKYSVLNKKGKLINKNRNTELRDVLTPEQFALYEKISKGNKLALKKTAECRKSLITSK